MEEHKYTQMQAKRRREIVRGDKTIIRFLGVFRYPVSNPNYIEKPEGKDTRTANQKRKTVWREVTKTLEAEKVTKAQGLKQKQKEEATEANIRAALEVERIALEKKEREAEEKKSVEVKTVHQIVREYLERRKKLSEAVNWNTSVTLPNNERVITLSTLRDYNHTLTYLEGNFPKVDVSELTAKYILDWERAEIEAGHSLSRVRKAHVLCKQALNDAVVNGIIANSPMASLKAPTLGKHDNNSLEQETARSLTAQLATFDPSEAVVGAMLALHCGMRGGEICALTWGGVDFESRHIVITQAVGIGDEGKYLKGTKSVSGARMVWMDDYVLDMLTRRKAQMLSERDNISEDFDSLFVVGNAGGDFLSPTTLSKQFTTLSKTLGLRGKTGEVPTLHKMRHTFADALRGGKGNDKAIRDVMGHSSKGITDLYGTKDLELMDEAVKGAAKWLAPKEDHKEAEVLDFPKTGTNG